MRERHCRLRDSVSKALRLESPREVCMQLQGWVGEKERGSDACCFPGIRAASHLPHTNPPIRYMSLTLQMRADLAQEAPWPNK